ncbi:hypothetical protein K3495_g7206 [Podosphaera aphanis]|nr:hypothetical protein K3495_g7206 [Podosphaera aphanis]
MSPITYPKGKSQIPSQQGLLKVKFEEFYRQLGEEKSKEGPIDPIESQNYIKETLRNCGANGEPIRKSWVKEVLQLLEGDNVCSRIHESIFILILEMILQAEDCQDAERGIYLLAVSFLFDSISPVGNNQKILVSRKAAIGKESLLSLIKYFVSTDKNTSIRRWVGILCLQLHQNCSENHDRIDKGPEEYRHALGKLIVEDTNKSLKIICGFLIKDLIQAGTQLHHLFPSSYNKTLYSGFPKATTDIDNWIQLFLSFLENLSSQVRIPQKRTTGLYFVKSVILNPNLLMTNKNNSIYMILDGNSILVLTLSLREVTFEQILEIPFHTISLLRLVLCETKDRAISLMVKIRFHEAGKANCFLNGKTIDLNNCALQINPVDIEFLLDKIAVAFPNLKLEDETALHKETEWNQRSFSRLSNHSSTCEIMVSNFKSDQTSEKISPVIENDGQSCSSNTRTNALVGLYNENCNLMSTHEVIGTNICEHAFGKAHNITGHYTRRLIPGFKVPYQQKATKPKAKQPLLVSRRSLASQAAMEASCQVLKTKKTICSVRDKTESHRLSAPKLLVKLQVPSLARNLQTTSRNANFKPMDDYASGNCGEETKMSEKINDRLLLPSKFDNQVRSTAPEDKKKYQRKLSSNFVAQDLKMSCKGSSEFQQTLKDRVVGKCNDQNKAVLNSLTNTSNSEEFTKPQKPQSYKQKDFQVVSEEDQVSNLPAEAYNLMQEDAKILGLVTEDTYGNLSYIDYFDSSPIVSQEDIIEHDDISKWTSVSKEIESESRIPDVINSKFNEMSVNNLSIELDSTEPNLPGKKGNLQNAEMTISQCIGEKIANQYLGGNDKNIINLSEMAPPVITQDKYAKKVLPADLTQKASPPENENVQYIVEEANPPPESLLNTSHSEQEASHLALSSTMTPAQLKNSQNAKTSNMIFADTKYEAIPRKRKSKDENFPGNKKLRIYEDSRKHPHPNSAFGEHFLEPIEIQTPQSKRLKMKSLGNFKCELQKYSARMVEQNIKESDKPKVQQIPKRCSRRIVTQKASDFLGGPLSSNADLLIDASTRKPHVISFGPDGARNQGQICQPKFDPKSIDYTFSSSRIKSNQRQRSLEKVFSRQRNLKEKNFKSDSSLCTTPPKFSSKKQTLMAEINSPKHIDESILRASTLATIPTAGFSQSFQRSKVTKTGSPISRKHSQQTQIEQSAIKIPSLDVEKKSEEKEIKMLSLDFEKQSEERQNMDQKSRTVSAFGPKFIITKMPKMGPPLPEAGIPELIRHETIDNIHYTDMNSREVISRETVHDPFHSQASQKEQKNQFVELLRESVLKTPMKIQEFDGKKKATKSRRVQRPKKSYDSLPPKSKKQIKSLHVSPISLCDLPGKRQISIECWNNALHSHYRGIHDMVHRIANDLIIRLAKEEDSMRLVIDQYMENGAKIVDQIRRSHEEERASILQCLDCTKTELINVQNKAQIEISGIYGGIRGNLISITAREWNKMQDEINKIINDSRRD